ESQEVELGKQAKQEAEQAYGIYKEKPELNQYIADIGKRLSAESGRASLPWSYEIVDDASVNAFALPGGPIFITRGILGHLNTEAQLAAVLGHETGHVAARHSANQMSKQQVAQLGLGIGSILSPTVASAAQVAGAGLQLLFLKYSREDETQADELGFRFMTKVGYDPSQMIPLFQMLDGVSKQAGAGNQGRAAGQREGRQDSAGVPGADAAGRDRGRDRVHLVSGKHVHDGRVRAAGRLVELLEYVRGRNGKLQRAHGLERSVGEARE